MASHTNSTPNTLQVRVLACISRHGRPPVGGSGGSRGLVAVGDLEYARRTLRGPGAAEFVW